MLAKRIKTNHELALSFWATGNVDAQFLATLLIQPKRLSTQEMDRMMTSVSFSRVAELNGHRGSRDVVQARSDPPLPGAEPLSNPVKRKMDSLEEFFVVM